MIIKTGRAGMVWVDWPPVEDGEVWCRGSALGEEGGSATTVYRLVDGAWQPGAWDAEGPDAFDDERRVRDALH